MSAPIDIIGATIALIVGIDLLKPKRKGPK